MTLNHKVVGSIPSARTKSVKGLIIISCVVMSGKEVAAKEKEYIREVVSVFSEPPQLAVLVVGNDVASQAYVRGKERDCNECGITCSVYRFDETITQDELCVAIDSLNNLSYISGIIVQLPLPKQIDKMEVIERIHPDKDVDCFRADNVGRLALEHPKFMPCTPAGIMKLLDAFNIKVDSKNCVVIGRSDIVGKPMAMMLTNMGGTVTICHSKTKNLAHYTRNADLIVCAVGKPNFLTADMVKDGAVVVDVGINRNEEGKLCGDVDFAEVSKKCSAITPVPGGVGLMTRVTLLKNTVKAHALLNRANSTASQY